ncbi:tetraspanin-10 [Callorhinus ursinus]|uniref:Tetraspanin-10 n=1 Tax=Callorhinus ursinus TaxID=34884 RepID=A0A3Q7PIK6_CALUR|nr:tetraspanin-10 [Callorhinus ursinus]
MPGSGPAHLSWGTMEEGERSPLLSQGAGCQEEPLPRSSPLTSRHPRPAPREDQVQLGLQCCGVSSYRDWTWNLYFNCSSPGVQACSLPASCCINPGEDGAAVNHPCGFGALGLDEGAAQRRVHLQGCGPPLRGWLHRNVRAVGACTIVAVVVQGVELLMAAQLVRAVAVRQVGGGEPQNRGDGKVPCQTGPGPTAP